VWRAERDSDGALAAIKIASADDPDTLERIEEEAGALRSLNHPHIVSLMESGPLDDHDDLEIAGQVPGGRTRARFRLRQPPAKSPRWLNVDLIPHEGSLKCVRLAH
jgi:serine/threonine protein kinase